MRLTGEKYAVNSQKVRGGTEVTEEGKDNDIGKPKCLKGLRTDAISDITRNKSSLSNGNKCQDSQIKPVQTKANAVKDNLTHPKLIKYV